MNTQLLPTFLCALTLAAVHVFTPRLTWVRAVPRSRWLSLAGGVAVAYVFMHLLPELAEHERTLRDGAEHAGAIVYALSLAGLVTFYGMERLIRGAREQMREEQGVDRAYTGVFWLHIASFAAYNLLIGYLLLHREETGWTPLLLYFTAMALHFFTNDFGLHQDHEELYDRGGRWVLAGAVVVGWALGASTNVREIALIALFSFLSGAVVLNVLKEELPEERKSRFLPFLIGVAGYGTLLVAV